MPILVESLAGRIYNWNSRTESPAGMIAPRNGSARIRGPSRRRIACIASCGGPIDSGRTIKRLELFAGSERGFSEHAKGRFRLRKPLLRHEPKEASRVASGSERATARIGGANAGMSAQAHQRRGKARNRVLKCDLSA